jgi:hypothetical protein
MFSSDQELRTNRKLLSAERDRFGAGAEPGEIRKTRGVRGAVCPEAPFPDLSSSSRGTEKIRPELFFAWCRKEKQALVKSEHL